MNKVSWMMVCMLLAPCAYAGDLPDAATTPGAVNPAVNQQDIRRTICVHGYSRGERPPAAYTNRLKRRQMRREHLAGTTRDYEEDHLISLEIGGSPKDPRNLWPEPYAGAWGARVKDRLENRLHRLVCNGRLPLAAAQQAIRTNWIAAYKRFVGPREERHRH